MTPIQMASLSNLIGLAIVLFASAIVSTRFPHPVFSRWLRAYLGVGVIVGMEFAATFTGRSLALDMGVFVAACWATTYLIATGRSLHGQRDDFKRWLPVLGAIAAVSVVLRLAGLPFSSSALPLLLTYVGSYFYLGYQLATMRRHVPGAKGWILGMPVAAIGLWMLIYPAMYETPFYWVGFGVAAVLQLVVGMGMMIFLLMESTRQLQEQNERLKQVDTIKSQLLSTVSHELRTPLTSVKGFMELLGDELLGPLNDTQTRAVQQSLKNVELLTELIDSIVNTAYGETFALKVQVIPVDLQAAVLDALDAVAPLIGAKSLKLDYAMPSEPTWVQADPLRLAQVLLNLVGNAVKFSEPNGRLWVTVERRPGAVCCVVKDEGIGIPPGALKNVFDPFFQADSRDTRAHGGIGLGLAIVQNLISAMGGEIHVESELGKGSTFWFTLPEAPPDPKPANTVETHR